MSTNSTLSLFDPVFEPIGGEYSEEPTANRITQKEIEAENKAAFLPLIAKFVAVFRLGYEVLENGNCKLTSDEKSIEVDIAYLRVVFPELDNYYSFHSSKLEPTLFKYLWPGKQRPDWFFDVFKPFKFEPM